VYFCKNVKIGLENKKRSVEINQYQLLNMWKFNIHFQQGSVGTHIRCVWQYIPLSFFLHTHPSHASAEACLTSWPNVQPQGRDKCSVARHHQANLMVCVVCSCCATSPYREVCRVKGGIGSGETLCHDIYPARPITTVSLAWWTAIAHAHLAPWAPGSNSAVRVNRAIDDRPGIQQEAICYQWFKQRLILSVSKPSISQWSQVKEDTVEPSGSAREFNLKV